MNTRTLSVLLGSIYFLSLPGTRGLVSPHPVACRRSPASPWHGRGGSTSDSNSRDFCSSIATQEQEDQPRQALPRRRRSTSPLFSTKQDQQPPRRPVPRFGVRSVDAPPARRAVRADQFSRPRSVDRRNVVTEVRVAGGQHGAGKALGGGAVASREASGRVGEAGRRAVPSAVQNLHHVSSVVFGVSVSNDSCCGGGRTSCVVLQHQSRLRVRGSQWMDIY